MTFWDLDRQVSKRISTGTSHATNRGEHHLSHHTFPTRTPQIGAEHPGFVANVVKGQEVHCESVPLAAACHGFNACLRALFVQGTCDFQSHRLHLLGSKDLTVSHLLCAQILALHPLENDFRDELILVVLIIVRHRGII